MIPQIAEALAMLQRAFDAYGGATVTAIVVDGRDVAHALAFEARRADNVQVYNLQPGVSNVTINGVRILT